MAGTVTTLKRRRLYLAFSIALAASTLISHAQTVTGAVSGVVTDASGAIVAGAQVLATNADTGVVTSATTNESGVYSIGSLPIGRYSLSIMDRTFAAYHSSIFNLDIDQTATINARLENGSSSEKVIVNANVAPILDQENPTLGITIDQQTISTLPMEGQSFFSTTVAVPGAVHSGGSSSEQPSVNGNREEANSVLLDGLDIYNTFDNTGVVYTPSPEAIQQVRVITANAGAEYGNVNGGQILLATISGTNQLHGQAFFKLQNYNMNANSWANKNNATATAITPYTETFFGGTLGGPLIKDKLFFFVDYQGIRDHQSGTSFSSVAPPAFRNGDLSLLLNPPAGSGGKANAPIQLYDSQHGFAPFVNNQIPVNSSIQQFINSHPGAYPLPNATPTDGIAQDNYIGPDDSYNHNDQGDVRMDWTASARDSFNGRYTMVGNGQGTISNAVPITFPNAPTSTTYKSFVINEVHVFSPEAVNNFTVGFGRQAIPLAGPTDPTGLFGTMGNSLVGLDLPPQQYPGFAYQTFSNTTIGSIGSYNTAEAFTQNAFSYSELFTLQLGRHLMKMGGQFVRYQSNYQYPGNEGLLGTYSYNGSFTSLPTDTTAIGYAYADYLLGYVQEQDVPGINGRFGQRQWRDGVFFEDDYKILPNLTLNLGVRYDYFQPIYEQNNKMTNVDLQTGALRYAGQDGNSRALYNPVYTMALPRIGFAYSVTPKSVIRGGYGISSYFEGMGVNLRLTQNAPWQTEFDTKAIDPSSGTAGGTPLQVGANPLTNLAPGTYRAWDTNDRPSLTQEFNLTLEHQLSSSTSIQAGYVGETGQHLAIPVRPNQLHSIGGVAPFASSLGQNAVITETRTGGYSNYNAVQVTFRKRESDGLDFTANYTYSKALSDAGQGFNGFSGANISYYQQNAYDLAAEYGPTGSDSTHNVSGTLVYQLPYGHGFRYGSDANRAMELAFGGWKVSSLASAFSGLPQTITSNGPYSSAVNAADAYANHLRPLHVTHRSIKGNWFGNDSSATPCVTTSTGGGDNGQCAYSTQSYTAFGTARPGSERGPGFEDIDFAAFKDFNVTDRQNVEFRADAYNALNLTSYGNPNTNASSLTFGQITSTRSTERHLQLALSYHF